MSLAACVARCFVAGHHVQLIAEHHVAMVKQARPVLFFIGQRSFTKPLIPSVEILIVNDMTRPDKWCEE